MQFDWKNSFHSEPIIALVPLSINFLIIKSISLISFLYGTTMPAIFYEDHAGKKKVGSVGFFSYKVVAFGNRKRGCSKPGFGKNHVCSLCGTPPCRRERSLSLQEDSVLI